MKEFHEYARGFWPSSLLVQSATAPGEPHLKRFTFPKWEWLQVIQVKLNNNNNII